MSDEAQEPTAESQADTRGSEDQPVEADSQSTSTPKNVVPKVMLAAIVAGAVAGFVAVQFNAQYKLSEESVSASDQLELSAQQEASIAAEERQVLISNTSFCLGLIACVAATVLGAGAGLARSSLVGAGLGLLVGAAGGIALGWFAGGQAAQRSIDIMEQGLHLGIQPLFVQMGAWAAVGLAVGIAAGAGGGSRSMFFKVSLVCCLAGALSAALFYAVTAIVAPTADTTALFPAKDWLRAMSASASTAIIGVAAALGMRNHFHAK